MRLFPALWFDGLKRKRKKKPGTWLFGLMRLLLNSNYVLITLPTEDVSVHFWRVFPRKNNCVDIRWPGALVRTLRSARAVAQPLQTPPFCGTFFPDMEIGFYCRPCLHLMAFSKTEISSAYPQTLTHTYTLTQPLTHWHTYTHAEAHAQCFFTWIFIFLVFFLFFKNLLKSFMSSTLQLNELKLSVYGGLNVTVIDNINIIIIIGCQLLIPYRYRYLF